MNRNVTLKHYTLDYYGKLIEYIKCAYPERNIDDYIVILDYILHKLPENEEDYKYHSIVVDDQDNIVGLKMYLPTKVIYKGQLSSMFWTFDSKVLDDYLKGSDAGMLLTLEWLQSKHLLAGAGLSGVAKTLHHKMKSKFVGKVIVYLKLNLLNPKSINFIYQFYKKDRIINYVFPETIEVKKRRFVRIYSENEIFEPSGPFWNPDILEFIRDHGFIKRRFFDYPKQHYIYKLEEENNSLKNSTYFVVRPIKVKNVNCLCVEDFRFDLKDKFVFDLIIKASGKISKNLNFAATFFPCSLNNIKKYFIKNAFVSRGNIGADIILKRSFKEMPQDVFFTAADSDYNFKK